MITMAKTARAVCLTEGCDWTASGPNSAEAALAHDDDALGFHLVHLTVMRPEREADPRESRGNYADDGVDVPGNIPEFPGASDLGEICNSSDIDGCVVHGLGTPWRREWDRLHPEDRADG